MPDPHESQAAVQRIREMAPESAHARRRAYTALLTALLAEEGRAQ